MARPVISLPLFVTEKHPCSYLDDEEARSAFINPSFAMTTPIYSELIQQGFRRSGDDVYSPYCPNCMACIPARLKVADFIPDRSQKRCRQKNNNTEVLIKPAEFDLAHYELYRRYQAARHQHGVMAQSSQDDYIHFLKSSWCQTAFVEFLIDGDLAAIAVVDQLENALSAVYTFFDPRLAGYGLGVYAVLWQIEWAKQLKKDYLYLGYLIKSCRKMSYKDKYQPLQIFRDKKWKLKEPI
ncbi:MAG: arginyltransferase [Methyloglobulus sp.]